MRQCEYCKKITSNPKYCSRSCAATVNNTIHQKRPRVISYCERCGSLVGHGWRKRKRFCDTCNQNIKDWTKITLNEHTKRFANRFQFNAHLRNLSRRVYRNSDLPKCCSICGYNRHYEVCHKKPVASFDDTATIAEVNHIDNLVALCPNCHWEFDHGLLTL